MSYCVKLEISFENPDGLEFIVFPESGGDKIKKIFGILKEIKIGNSDFDDRYLIRGNDEEKIVRLFSKPNIQEIMLNRFGLYLELTQKYLILYNYLPIRDINHLKMIYDWFSEVLNELCFMDSGYENQ